MAKKRIPFMKNPYRNTSRELVDMGVKDIEFDKAIKQIGNNPYKLKLFVLYYQNQAYELARMHCTEGLEERLADVGIISEPEGG